MVHLMQESKGREEVQLGQPEGYEAETSPVLFSTREEEIDTAIQCRMFIVRLHLLIDWISEDYHTVLPHFPNDQSLNVLM